MKWSEYFTVPPLNTCDENREETTTRLWLRYDLRLRAEHHHHNNIKSTRFKFKSHFIC